MKHARSETPSPAFAGGLATCREPSGREHRRGPNVGALCAATLLACVTATELASASEPTAAEAAQDAAVPRNSVHQFESATTAIMSSPDGEGDDGAATAQSSATEYERREFDAQMHEVRTASDRAAAAIRDSITRYETLAAALAGALSARSAELVQTRRALQRELADARAIGDETARVAASEKAAAQELRLQLEAERSRAKRAEQQVADLAAQQSQRARSDEAASQGAEVRRVPDEMAKRMSDRIRQEQAKVAGAQRQLEGLRQTLEAERTKSRALEAKLADASRPASPGPEKAQRDDPRGDAMERLVQELRAGLDRKGAEAARLEMRLADLVREQAKTSAEREQAMSQAVAAAVAAWSERDALEVKAVASERQLDAVRADTRELLAWVEQRTRRTGAAPDGQEPEPAQPSLGGMPIHVDGTMRAVVARLRAVSGMRGGNADERSVELPARSPDPRPRLSFAALSFTPIWAEVPPPKAAEERTPAGARPAVATPIQPPPQEIGSQLSSKMETRAAEPARGRQPEVRRLDDGASGAATQTVPPAPAATERRPVETANAKVAKPEPKAPQADGAAAALLARADAYLSREDVVGARLLLEHAAASGNALALMKLAETYDPRSPIIRRLGGSLADRERALQLYASALTAGLSIAEDRIATLR